MRKTSVILTVLFVLASTLTAAEDDPAAIVYEELTAATSNSWGKAISDFQAAANSKMRTLAEMRTAAAVASREKWLIWLMLSPVSTNDYRAYKAWVGEKSSWLFGAGRSFRSLQYTNLWLSAAAAIGEIRQNSQTPADLLARARQEHLLRCQEVRADGQVVVTTGLPDWYYEEVAHLSDQESAAAMMISALIVHFAGNGMVQMPERTRWQVYSNIVERAHLNEDESDRLRKAMQ